MKTVRLYGLTIGHGSLARVTDGMQRALTELGCFAGLVPCDAYDGDACYGGADADIAVLVGANFFHMARGIGWHKQIWALMPPNSTWVPEEPLRQLASAKVGLIAPSQWALETLTAAAKRAGAVLPISLWPHGVTSDFAPSEAAYEEALAAYKLGRFHVAHLASEPARKGTAELLAAWCEAVEAGELGPKPMLRLVADAPEASFRSIAAGASAKVLESIVWTKARVNLSPAMAPKFYRAHHVICQPSRGEGFSLVPLESRACGVPIVITGCTGDSEYARWPPLPPGMLVDEAHTPGVWIVKTGPLAPICDGPDGMAPSLAVSDVRDALGRAYKNWPRLAREAMDLAPELGKAWSWAKTTREWLARVEGGAK